MTEHEFEFPPPTTYTPQERQHIIDTAPPGGEVLFLADMPLADTKGIFVADGTFQISTNTAERF